MSIAPSVHEIVSAYAALTEDVWRVDSDLVPHFDQAVKRLGQLIETRGMRVVLLELPAFGKLFDKSLSTGYLDVSKLPPSLGSWKKGSYIFQDLLLTRFYDVDNRRLLPDVHPGVVFFLRTFMYLGKYSISECPTDEVAKTVQEFFQLDKSLRTPTLDWNGDQLHSPSWGVLQFSKPDSFWERPGLLPLGSKQALTGTTKRVLSLLDIVCQRTGQMFGTLDPSTVVGRHGPGAVADLKSGQDKYSFPNWPRKLDLLFPREYHSFSREDMILEYDRMTSPVEPEAKLLAVPKDYKGPRLITSEPTAHQFLQQGLMRWIRRHLPDHLCIAIDFSSQIPSRDLAQVSSMGDKMATIDLSSASDRLTLWTVERAIQNHSILQALHASRTRRVRDATGVTNPPQCTTLRKYAGMGNATTFPVQSIVYALCCITAVLYDDYGSTASVTSKTLKAAAQKVRVYGDDIIIPSSAGLILTTILEFLELKVNWAKTHVKGTFRESCGMDAFKGSVVTPLYLQSFKLSAQPSPRELQSWIDVSNNAFQQGLWSLVAWMDNQIPMKIRKWLITSTAPWIMGQQDENLEWLESTSDAQGGLRLHTHLNGVRSSRKRFNSDLHREEYHSLVIAASRVWSRRDTPDSLLQYFVEAPSPDSSYRSGWSGRSRLRFLKRWVPS